MSLLCFSDVEKAYRNEQGSTEVLRGISLSVERQTIRVLLGRSGSGKTTILRLAAGLAAPDGGLITFDGAPVRGPSCDRFMIFQDYNQLFPWKRVAENIVFALRAQVSTLSRKEAQAQAAFWLREMELGNNLLSWPAALSGGMKQRAALARAFALKPKLLLLDEPFAGLDALLRRSMQALLINQCEKHGLSALFVTHDMDEAFALDAAPMVLQPDGGAILTVTEETHTREMILELLGWKQDG